MAVQPITTQQIVDAQLRQLQDLCSCRQNAQCQRLMRSLALRGLLPIRLVTMTDEEWLAACRLSQL